MTNNKQCNACKAEKKYDGRSYLHICGKSNEKENLSASESRMERSDEVSRENAEAI